jgi:NADH dehydrogenase [ubiquinone] 1 alpha subcomplex assembly factor 1
VLIPKAKKPAYKPMSGAQFLEYAVEKGIPLFNSKNYEACVSVSEVAVRATLDLNKGIVTPETARDMKDLLAKSAGQENARNKAWTLRKAINLAWTEMQRKPSSKRTALTPMKNKRPVAFAADAKAQGKALFSFDEQEKPWFSVNDNVMGGISRGGFSRTDTGNGLFSGALSLKNNGGFSTIRSPARNLGLANYDGVILRVRGDGRTYNFSARKDDSLRGVLNWQTSFETKKGEWMDIRIPFDKLSLRIMGRWVRGAKGISPSDVRGFSVSIADKDETPYRLEIASIRAIDLKA